MKFLLLFLAIPIIEVAVFVKVGGVIGGFWTIALTLGTALLGAFLVRAQGIRTLFNVKNQLAQGQLPASAMVEGIILLVAGALLLVPGFISDVVGFLGLIPFVRTAFAKRIVLNAVNTKAGSSSSFQQSIYTGYVETESVNKTTDHTTIEGKFTREK